MNNSKQQPQPNSSLADRADRRAAALRENLRKRKTQAQTREDEQNKKDK